MSSGDGDDSGSPIVNKIMESEACAGISSERPGANNSEVFNFHGTKNVISEPEASNAFSGRKRSSPSSYMSLVRDKMLSLGSDSLENSRLMKTFGKSHDYDEMPYSIQLPPRSASSLLLHPPLGGRSGSLNPGIMGQDEGSRTGMKGSAILNIINSERKTTGSFPYTNKSKAPRIVEPESSNVPSRYNLPSSTRQMTIFYAGQAHVFDDVHPNKADVILALAGSSGVSWTTNCNLKPGFSPPINETSAPSKEKGSQINNFQVSIPIGPARGLSQVLQIPLTNDLQSHTPGVHQVDRAGIEAAEPDRDSEKDA